MGICGSKNGKSLVQERSPAVLAVLACVWACVKERFSKKRKERKRDSDGLTGESFWMRSWATCTKFLSSCMCFWKRRLSSSSSRSKSLAASSRAWISPFQERRAGTCGATAELTPVPITRTSSGARLVFRLGSSFLQKQAEIRVMSGPHMVLPKSLLQHECLNRALSFRTGNHFNQFC